jgi:KaiC/GvpD/RAD55 family RecA-like ATPase
VELVTGFPDELVQFFNRPPPHSLILRGAPGTGKSLLALALIESFPGQRIYVSSRVPRSQLTLEIPSFRRLTEAGQLSVVDMSANGADLPTASRSLGSALRIVEPEDAAADLRALLLPPEVLEAWSRASSSTPTLVVLDSWDAIIERHVGAAGKVDGSLPSREDLERIALAQMARGPVVLVMVVEREGAGQLEYLVDGILTVEREIQNDRTERWLRIEKLRGTRIGHSSYPFSLDGGRFRPIVPLRMDRRPPSPRGEPSPGPSAGRIWPGSADYASFFGWIPVGKITLIETDLNVPNAAVRMLLAPIVNSVVAGGGRVLHLPPPGMQPTELWNVYQGATSRETFLRQVRIFCPGQSGEPDELAQVRLPMPSSNTVGHEYRIPEAMSFLKENSDPGKPNLASLSTAGMEAINELVPGALTAARIPSVALNYLHQSPLHEIFIGSAEDPITRVIRPMADIHVRVTYRDGRVFLHGIIPRTPSLVLAEGDDQAPYHLLLVV